MDRKTTFLLLIGGLAAYYFYQQSQMPETDDDSALSFSSDPLSAVSDVIVAATLGWQNSGDGSIWMPALNAAEVQFGIPTNLLARIAYQESHFRTDIINGTTVSPAGALGLMQLMPQFFTSVRVARPFQASDTLAQIQQAGQLLASDYASLGDWGQAVAAYNAGLSTIQNGTASAANAASTANYVSQILADVPAANS